MVSGPSETIGKMVVLLGKMVFLWDLIGFDGILWDNVGIAMINHPFLMVYTCWRQTPRLTTSQHVPTMICHLRSHA